VLHVVNDGTKGKSVTVTDASGVCMLRALVRKSELLDLQRLLLPTRTSVRQQGNHLETQDFGDCPLIWVALAMNFG